MDRPRDLVNLSSIAQAALARDLKLRVCGYADKATGRDSYNNKLSKRRAEAVAAELVRLGVPEENLLIEGMGGVDEIEPSSHNRRVIVSLIR